VSVVAVGLIMTGCTSKPQRAVSEATVRNAAAVAAAKEFADHGFPIPSRRRPSGGYVVTDE